MKRTRCSVAVLIGVLICTGAGASEQSERLYSRGLVEFHAERYAEALVLFDQAVNADPQDVYALYYRGVTHGRLKENSAAVADLRAVLKAKPDLEQAALELGICLVQSGTYAEAVPLLERAQQLPESEAPASLFLGIAQLKLGQRDGARQQLQRAAARDPQLKLASDYYQGIADYQDQRWDDAERHFTAVVTTSPESEMGREATTILERLHAKAPLPSWQVVGEAGLQYDSNVALAPSNEPLKAAAGISRQSDGRAILSVGGTYVPVRNERVQLSLSYEIYQSLHFNLHEFNLQDHRPGVQLLVAAGPALVGLLGYYDYYLLDNDSFLQGVTVFPWVEVPTGSFGRTQLSYRARVRDFYQQPFKNLRNSTNHAPGIRQLINLGSPDRYALLSYQFDREDPERSTGSAFGYDGNQVAAGVGWAFPYDLTTELVYAYRHEEYDPQSQQRRDNEHRVTLFIEHPLTEHLSLLLAYFGMFNNSTDPLFEYDRNIGSVSVRARF